MFVVMLGVATILPVGAENASGAGRRSWSGVVRDGRAGLARAEVGVGVRGLVVGIVSGCLAVLVDESVAGGVSLDRPAGPVLDDFRSARCTLM